jgi:hypothetical protein
MNEKIYNLACRASKEVRQECPELPIGLNARSWLFGGPKFKVFMVTEHDVEKLVELAVKDSEIRKHFGIEA